MFTVRLSYIEGEVWAAKTTYLYFPLMMKLVFLHVPIFYNVEKSPYYYYGTLSMPLGDQFLGIRDWDVEIERQLYYQLGNLGLIRSIASLWPLAEENN